MDAAPQEFSKSDLFILGVLGVFSLFLIVAPSAVGLYYLWNWYKENYLDPDKKDRALSADAETTSSTASGNYLANHFNPASMRPKRM